MVIFLFCGAVFTGATGQVAEAVQEFIIVNFGWFYNSCPRRRRFANARGI